MLSKYVGQSEENIRNLFADAEAEQNERGDDSDLHIIIFDEIDSVCKVGQTNHAPLPERAHHARLILRLPSLKPAHPSTPFPPPQVQARGSTRDSTGVADTVVNQLLSKIDGVNSLNNILVSLLGSLLLKIAPHPTQTRSPSRMPVQCECVERDVRERGGGRVPGDRNDQPEGLDR